MEMDKLSFVEAIEELAQRAHVELPADDAFAAKDDSEKTQLYKSLREACQCISLGAETPCKRDGSAEHS